jgi:hypothetical protein
VLREGVLFGWDLGGKPTLFFLGMIAPLLLTTAFALLYKLRRRSTRPWFRRKVNHSAMGRLPGD